MVRGMRTELQKELFYSFVDTRAIWKSTVSPSLFLEGAETQSRSTALSGTDVCQIHLHVMSAVSLNPMLLSERSKKVLAFELYLWG